MINIDPEILGGTPVFMGTRVPVESLFDHLKHGHMIEYFLGQFPRVEPRQIQNLLDEAHHAVLASCGNAAG